MGSYFGDLQNTALAVATLPAHAAYTGNTNGAGADMELGDGNNFNVLLNIGVYNVGTGDEVYTITITESTDNSTFTALWRSVSFVLSAAAGAAGTAQVAMLYGMRSKRYLRVELTVAGTGPSILLDAVFLEPLKIAGSGGGYYSAPQTSY